MNIASIFVLYNPQPPEIEKIKKYCEDFEEIDWVVVDNSKSPIDNYDEVKNCKYVHNNNIGGIAGAISRGIEHTSENTEYVFTFDQDSVIPHNFFQSMANFIREKNAKLVCSNFFDVNSKTFAKFVHLNKFNYDVVSDSDYTTFAISSGMGINKSFWLEMNGVNENYIIDHVDTEICLKAHSRGERIYINYDICLEHAIGERKVYKFLGVTLKPNNHNHIRKYYIVRNGTHLAWKYLFKYPGYFYLNILRLIHEFLCTILYEKNKIKKLRYMAMGLIHSCLGKLGAAK